MIHKMKLLPDPFERIKSEKKVMELRLLDDKRKLVNVTDEIIFSKLPDLNEKITIKVTSLQIFSSFDEFATEENLVKLGIKRTKEQFIEDIHKIYTKEKELKFGVLTIGVSLLD